MFDNIALNIVIGLVFIYLLYSLLATMLCEWISTKLGVRARLLRLAIERMLNDGYYVKIERSERSYFNVFRNASLSIAGWARKVLLFEPEAFKNSMAGKFYQYPAIKYLGRIEDDHKGLFNSTKPSYLSSDYFANTLIDFLNDKGAGKETRERIAFALIYNTHHIQPKSLKQLKNLFADTQSIEQFKKNLMKWFDETMDRANGWYKRKAQLITFIVGFIIAISFNVDTIGICSLLSTNETARAQLVQMGIQASDSNSVFAKKINKAKDTSLQSDSIAKAGYYEVKKAADAAQHTLGLGWDRVKAEPVYLFSKTLHFNLYRQYNPFRKEFWGIILTALAMSLGAPFWFDLLKKLVAIRGAGVKPEEKKPGKEPDVIMPAPDKAVAPVVAAIAAAVTASAEDAVDIQSLMMKDEQGIVAIALEGNPAYLSVMTEAQSFATYLSGKYGKQLAVNPSLILPIQYKTATVNILHNGMAGGGIANLDHYPDSVGTLGCFLQKKGSDKHHILSCWHVMKDNNNLWEAIVKTEIIEIKKTGNDTIATVVNDTIATVVDGCFSDALGIDAGIAECITNDLTINPQFAITGQHRPVDAFDSLVNTPVMLYGKASGKKTAVIFHHKINALLPYPDGQKYLVRDVFSITVIDPNTGKGSSPTFGGDSGAVVTTLQGIPLGMIIGGNNTFSYAMKFTNLFNDPTKPYHAYSFLIK